MRVSAAVFTALAFAAAGVCQAQSKPAAARSVPIALYAGFVRSSFSGVNETDAQAALKAFAVRTGEQRGYAVTPHIYIFDDVAAMSAHLKRERLDIAFVDTWDYLNIAPIANLPAELAVVARNAVLEDYVVLVRKGSGLARLADLAGKIVLVLRSSNCSTVLHWFRTEIMAVSKVAPESFLGRMEIREKLLQVVLPVFFGKADACAVDRTGFKIMIEMNPQIGERLDVLCRSEPFLDTLCCIRREGWEREDARAALLDALLNAAADPAGRQITTLFKVNAMVPFEERYLDSMRALRAKHDALLKQIELRPPPREAP
jgi:phosphonate transport system substrate-binding protein